MAETFSPQRMQRCADIAHKIIAHWEATNTFTYVVRATDSVDGIDLAELRKRNFAVGVGDDLAVVPLSDVLVIISIIEKQAAAMKAVKVPPLTSLSIPVQVASDFSDEEAVRLLSQIRIETPFDKGPVLRFSSTPPT